MIQARLSVGSPAVGVGYVSNWRFAKVQFCFGEVNTDGEAGGEGLMERDWLCKSPILCRPTVL
jgi:hypothetical protein